MHRWLQNTFLPGHADDDLLTRRRADRVLAFSLAMIIWSPVFAPIYALLGSPRSGVLIFLAGVACCLNLALFRQVRSVAWSGNALAGIVMVTLDGLSLFSGGSDAPALMWLPSVPLIATLLCGTRSGMIWLLLSGLWPGVLFAAERSGFVAVQEFQALPAAWIHLTSLWGIIICTTLLGLIFSRGEAVTQDRLKQARDKALEASRVKSQFMANMSHEIRTPLNGVIGLTRLVLETDLNDAQRRDLESVRHSAQSLLEIVNDILDYSKVEAGRLELESFDFRLRDLVREVVENASAQIDPALVQLSWTVEPRVPDRLLGDRKRVRQIFTNLVGNAVKFTRHGEVQVEVKLRERTPRSVEIHASVRDTGIGIPADKQGEIFEAFAQADSTTTRLYGGTGLGLSIASSLVEQMGGRLWLESREGVGTTFHFTLRLAEPAGTPVEPARPAEASPTVRPQRRGLRVLLAEDNPINQLLARRLLEKDGHRVEVAGNGAEALALWGMRPFDAVVMDVQMPILDGLTASRLIRLRERQVGTRTPIIALTAHALKGYDRKCEAAGMDGYVSKPIDIASLRQALPAEAKRATPPGATRSDTSERPDAPPLLPESLALDWPRDEPDRQLRGQLADQFQEAVPILLEELSHAVDTRDPEALRKTLQATFAISAVVGAEEVLDSVRQMTSFLPAPTGDSAAVDSAGPDATVERPEAGAPPREPLQAVLARLRTQMPRAAHDAVGRERPG